MTITFGFWMVPAIITLAGIIHLSVRSPTDMWDLGGAIVGLAWFVAMGMSWGMWLLSWLFA
ncbi:hypothetical protein [Citreimonas sp.]|uniref:hypothetical protein n=1 Tax=Citreimonas sp. TaxID=3036715 RepID=UPI004057DAEF